MKEKKTAHSAIGIMKGKKTAHSAIGIMKEKTTHSAIGIMKEAGKTTHSCNLHHEVQKNHISKNTP
jgi:hypothetical protein